MDIKLMENEVESLERICLVRRLLELYFVWEGLLGKRSSLASVPKLARYKPETDGGQENRPGNEASPEENGSSCLSPDNIIGALPLDMSQQSPLCSQTSLSCSFCHLQSKVLTNKTMFQGCWENGINIMSGTDNDQLL